MADFKLKLAGIPILAHTVFDFAENFCRDYLTEEAPLIEVTVGESDILFERRINGRPSDGCAVGACPGDKYLETLALLRKVSDVLIFNDVILLHGCAAAVEGKAYIFTAKSGTGKTTHCRLWLEAIPGSYILNGDKPFVLFGNGQAFACGSPWQGKEHLGVNEILPLEAICILNRADSNHIERISFKDAFPALFTHAYRPSSAEGKSKALSLLGQLDKTGLFRLDCNTDPEGAFLSYYTMSGKKP